ncbi:MAG: endopeptidase La [Candidatus Zixiibacteriota bacterium]
MMQITHNSEEIKIPPLLPLLPLRDVVIFPYMVYPLLLGRHFSIDALQEAMVKEKLVFLCTQKRSSVEEPAEKDIYRVGTIARILQVMKLPNGMLKVLVEGITRAKVTEYLDTEHFAVIRGTPFTPKVGKAESEIEALARLMVTHFEEYIKLNRRIPDEVLLYLSNIEDPQRLGDTVSAHALLKVSVKQKLLEVNYLRTHLKLLTDILKSEIEILKIEEKIDGSVRESLSKSQREFYLQHQLRAIKEELGQSEDNQAEADEYVRKLKKLSVTDQAMEKATDEIDRLRKMHPYSAEATVVRSYLDWLLGMPWGIHTEDRTDFRAVSAILDADHFGLDKAKKRIREHLAVLQLIRSAKGPILCFVGPPGVGKTSVGKSIAGALNRKFVRMSLGGVRDEAEIRGHRRTYIGALPGRIIQSLKKAESSNPVFLLDEVDKIGADFRGDPSSALLEVLDPEQNSTFVDHFLEVEYDLSKVLFLTTANTLHGIPIALLDRMEVIHLPGYLDFEKLEIAKKYLIPKLRFELGVEKLKINIPDNAIMTVVRDYTREAGVRELERLIASLFRKIAEKHVISRNRKAFTIRKQDLTRYLGAPRYTELEVGVRPRVGRAVGLAWTSHGGEILPIEVSLMDGASKLTLTGKLGDVIKESANAALSYIRSNSRKLKLKPDFYKDREVHVHIPEGAVPKDGPSAGISLLTALVSAFSEKPVRTDVAMTGEITLMGDVLPVGGLNEKFIAAKRAGIKEIICPRKNEKDIKELPKELLSGLKIHKVRTASEVLRIVFGKNGHHAKD